MLDEAFNKRMLLEGKHWPADYVKTGVNLIKASQLGKQNWYSDNYIQQDMQTFANEFEPLSHKNSNLGFFSTIVKWFIEYSSSSKEKYQEFIERKLDGIIGTLQVILNDPSYDKLKDEIKQKWTFQQFEELQKKIADEAFASSDKKMKNIVKRDDYEVIPIYSYEELHEKFGGNKTGYKGKSEWCHTNGKSTYESWTKDGTQMFFVLAKKGWQKITPPDPQKTNAYDEYGLSLIAILVDVKTGSLLNETLRWNHIVEPSHTNPGASVDKAFKNNWGELSQAVGMNVKSICKKECRGLKAKLEKMAKDANEEVEKILSYVDEIRKDTIPKNIKKHITSVVIPSNVKSIDVNAFYNCISLTSVTIPDSVTSIGSYAFDGCNKLKNVTIPDSVMSIWEGAFYGCSNLTSMTIPDKVTNIEWFTFEDCTNLMSVTIGNSVTSIGEDAFAGCTNLESVTIPDSVMSIEDYAFSECDSLTSVTIGNGVMSIGQDVFYMCSNLKRMTFKGKTLEEVKAMKNYPFGIEDESIIKCQNNLNENKAAYLQKYRDEEDAIPVVDQFWTIRNRLSTPQNDIDWWIKKPFSELKSFVQNFDTSNKRQRRDANYKQQAIDNGAKLLDTKDGYEMWYVPTYDAMVYIGRFYKGRSAKWCIASDDPDFWFDNHEDSEFVVLVREHPKNDEFDKVAIEMMNHGRYYNEDDIIPWDLENNDYTFDRGVIDNSEELVHYAWQLFKDNGETRERYFG